MSTNHAAIYSPRFELQVGGTTYQEAGGRVGDLLVEQTLDGAALCTFILNYPYNPEHQEFDEFDWSAVEPGTALEVSVGWGGGGSVERVFVGTTQSVKADFDPDGAAVSVSGYGPLHGMMQGVTERSWSETTVVDVAQEVLGEHFSSVDVEGSASQQNRIIQHGTNDYRFVRRLAEEHGFEFYADGDTARFVPRSSVRSERPAVTLTYGNALDTFSGEVTAAEQVASVEVRYWDMQAEKEVVGAASSGNGSGKEVFRIQCDSKEEADAIAESKLSALSMTRVQGYGETDGVPELTPGTVLRLEGLGERFTGEYYVTQVTHRMGNAGYRTSFEVTELPE